MFSSPRLVVILFVTLALVGAGCTKTHLDTTWEDPESESALVKSFQKRTISNGSYANLIIESIDGTPVKLLVEEKKAAGVYKTTQRTDLITNITIPVGNHCIRMKYEVLTQVTAGFSTGRSASHEPTEEVRSQELCFDARDDHTYTVDVDLQGGEYHFWVSDGDRVVAGRKPN